MPRKASTPKPAAPVTVAAAVSEVVVSTPATLDTLTADIRDLANVVRALVGHLTPMLTTGTVKAVTPKIATTAGKAAKAPAPKAPKHRTPAVGEVIAVGDLVSLPVGALKGKCGSDLSGVVTGVVLSLGSLVAKNRGDMPVGLEGTVLTIKLSSVRNVWAWTGDTRVALTGKKIVEETVVA
jgi:hypothetical protein